VIDVMTFNDARKFSSMKAYWGPSDMQMSAPRVMNLQEMSDRATGELVVDLQRRHREREFENLDRIFTPDAYIDYRANGRHRRRVSENQGVAAGSAQAFSGLRSFHRQPVFEISRR